MSLQPLTTALIQLTSTDDFSSNCEQVFVRLEQVRSQGGARLILLPENSLYLRLNRESKLEALSLDHPIFKKLSVYCCENRCHFLMTTPVQEPEVVSNATLHLDDQGSIQVVYRKIHLFDVNVRGVPTVRESDDFSYGSKLAAVEVDGWKIGLSICYDLRFSELFSLYVRQGVHALAVPAAFLVPTGRAHWEVLLRARAIETQSFVLAPAQGGVHENSHQDRRKTWGHSMVVSPWGEVLAEVESSEASQVLIYTLDPSQIESVRKQIPMSGHRRLN